MDAGAGTTTARRRRTSLRAVPAAVLATLIALAAGLTGGIGPVRTDANAAGSPTASTAAALAPTADATLRAESTLDSVVAAIAPSSSSASGPVAITAATVLVALVLLRLGVTGGPRRAVPARRARTRRDRAPPRGTLLAA